jgi:hypothetical protein
VWWQHRQRGRRYAPLTFHAPREGTTAYKETHWDYGDTYSADGTFLYRATFHLVEKIVVAHSEGMGEKKTFGDDGLRIARDLFAAWQGYQQDGDRARLQAQIAPLHDKLRALLENAARKSTRTKYHRLFAKSLLKRWPALWTFTHTDGVQPTNNHAERGLRGAVIYRKLSLGSQSERGERTIERLLSASVTCRLQKRSLFAYLTDVLHANIRGDPIPALSRPDRDLNAYLDSRVCRRFL